MLIQQLASSFCQATDYRLQLPHSVQRLYLRYFSGEKEIILLPSLCDPSKMGIDVGAATGLYTLFMSRLCSKVAAFEPLHVNGRALQSRFRGFNVTVFPYALGKDSASMEFRTPVVGGKELRDWSSLSKRFEGAVWEGKPISQVTSQMVNVKPLDDFGFENVGILKIDVEGFEDEVIKGAEKTLKKSRPSLIIETENRHRSLPLQASFSLMEKMDYRGFFIWEQSLRPVCEFDPASMQCPEPRNGKGSYVSNFVWLPEGSDVIKKCASVFSVG